MVTYVSTSVDVLVQGECIDGRWRQARATPDPSYSTNGTLCDDKKWAITVEHPSGWSRSVTIFGSRDDAHLKMVQMLSGTRAQFRQEGERSDMPTVELDPMRNHRSMGDSQVRTMWERYGR